MAKKYNIDIENDKINILVIDDEEDMREFVAMCLEDFGYNVTKASDGADGIIQLNSNKFDLIISDIEMPKITGLDLLKLIKKENNSVSVIMLTGVKKVTTAIEVLKLGAEDYLIKPIKVEELKLSVEKSIYIRKLKEQNINLIKENEKYQVQLENMVEKRTEQLEDAIFSSLTIVASAIEAKDPYTRGHSNRVRLISLDIAKTLGLSDDELSILEYGAMLHDVGKIGIRDEVLLKKGKLDNSEYEHIMSHPYVGSRIIENINYYAPMIDCVKYHHEKYDGTGYPNKIVSGTTQITTKPEGLLIANYASQLVLDAGLADEQDFSFQAGAGGMSLAFVKYLGDYLRKNKKFASFARGGSTKYLVDMLDEGLVKYILDGQSFDLAGVKSLRENANHISTNPFVSYNYHTKGCFAPKVKTAVLGATEVDLDFNVNVNTHSDGWLLHGIGGFTDCTDSYMTIITAPLVRKVNPIIVDRVHTITAPGSNIDAIVTDQGIAINPKRDDIKERLKNSTLPIISIEELREKAYKITGDRPTPVTTDEPVAVIEYRDGTVIDTVFKLETE